MIDFSFLQMKRNQTCRQKRHLVALSLWLCVFGQVCNLLKLESTLIQLQFGQLVILDNLLRI